MKSVPVLINKKEFIDYNQKSIRADVFSRSALEHTFRLLRPSHPHIALVIQNVLMSTPLSKPAGLMGDSRTDNFELDLDPEQIQAIIKALTAQASVTELKNIQGNISALGNLVLLKSMLGDWVELARLYIDAEGSMEPVIQYAANL